MENPVKGGFARDKKSPKVTQLSLQLFSGQGISIYLESDNEPGYMAQARSRVMPSWTCLVLEH